MPSQIVKQPNGLYATFSTVTDFIGYYHISRDEMIALRVANGRSRDYVEGILDQLDADVKPHELAVTWDEMLEDMRHVHGDKKVDDFLEDYRKSDPVGSHEHPL